MLKKDEAVCIRTADYSETSQIVTFFSRAGGKLRVIAKGSKRPKSAFGGPIEIFSLGQLVFAELCSGKLSTLTEFEPKTLFAGLRRNLYALNCALFAAELLNALTEDSDPHPELFDNFVQFLGNCERTKEKKVSLAILIRFQMDLLHEIGTALILNSCVNCKSVLGRDWREVYFSSSANGLLCHNCEASFQDKRKLSKQAAKCLSDLKVLTNASGPVLDEIEKVLIYHFTALLHRPPKMAKYIITP